MRTAASISNDLSFDQVTIFVFDADCAMVWSQDEIKFTPHQGSVELPIGDIPVGITSFATTSPEGAPFFAMALPTVWEDAGFSSDLSTEDFTLGVFAHEISHIWQFDTYLAAIQGVTGIELLPQPVNDDIVQRLFSKNESFVQAVTSEISAFRSVAYGAPSAVRDARSAMEARWQKHYVGENAALAGAQDIFLTLEGSGQWFAIETLVQSGVERETAINNFGQRGNKWSQDLGLAITQVLDAHDPDWAMTVYGAGEKSLLELLDDALVTLD